MTTDKDSCFGFHPQPKSYTPIKEDMSLEDKGMPWTHHFVAVVFLAPVGKDIRDPKSLETLLQLQK